MQYLITFLEGIITFISPCLLPMLPIYISYFAGKSEDGSKHKTLSNVGAFILGFTAVFVLLGALAGTLGRLISNHRTLLDIITGLIVILFGLQYLGVIKVSLFKGTNATVKSNMSFLSSFIFGVVFSIGWTPCVGAFLGSALMLASNRGSALSGVLLLLCYSLGLAIPFAISAVLIDKLKSTFGFIKNNYRIINTVCGIFLIITGVLMATGLLGTFLSNLSS